MQWREIGILATVPVRRRDEPAFQVVRPLVIGADQPFLTRGSLGHHGTAIVGTDVVKHAHDALTIAKDQDRIPEDPQRLDVARVGNGGSVAHRNPAAGADAVDLQIE